MISVQPISEMNLCRENFREAAKKCVVLMAVPLRKNNFFFPMTKFRMPLSSREGGGVKALMAPLLRKEKKSDSLNNSDSFGVKQKNENICVLLF